MTQGDPPHGKPGRTPALLWRSGKIAFKRRDYEAAAADLRRIIGEFGEDAAPAPIHELRLQLGVCLLRLGRPEEGVVHLARAVEANPDVPRAHFKLGLGLARLKRNTEALEEFRKASDANPQQTTFLTRLAAQYARMGMAEEAREAFARVLLLAPGHPDAEEALAALGPTD